MRIVAALNSQVMSLCSLSSRDTSDCEMCICDPWKRVTVQCVTNCNFSVSNVSGELYAPLCVTDLAVGQRAILIFAENEWKQPNFIRPNLIDRSWIEIFVGVFLPNIIQNLARETTAHSGVSACDQFCKCEYSASVWNIWKVKWHEL
jgi:hypothetical protein